MADSPVHEHSPISLGEPIPISFEQASHRPTIPPPSPPHQPVENPREHSPISLAEQRMSFEHDREVPHVPEPTHQGDTLHLDDADRARHYSQESSDANDFVKLEKPTELIAEPGDAFGRSTSEDVITPSDDVVHPSIDDMVDFAASPQQAANELAAENTPSDSFEEFLHAQALASPAATAAYEELAQNVAEHITHELPQETAAAAAAAAAEKSNIDELMVQSGDSFELCGGVGGQPFKDECVDEGQMTPKSFGGGEASFDQPLVTSSLTPEEFAEPPPSSAFTMVDDFLSGGGTHHQPAPDVAPPSPLKAENLLDDFSLTRQVELQSAAAPLMTAPEPMFAPYVPPSAPPVVEREVPKPEPPPVVPEPMFAPYVPPSAPPVVEREVPKPEPPVVPEPQLAPAPAAAPVMAKTEKTCSTCSKFRLQDLDPRVLELIYWRDVKKSAVVFGGTLLLLLALATYSIVSVFAYLSLALLTVTINFRIYKYALGAIQKKTDEGNPFKQYLDKDLGLNQNRVHEQVDVIVRHVQELLLHLRRLFLVEDFVDSLKFGVLLWALTYVGAWFSGTALVVLSFIALFTIPKFYETYKTQIDHYYDLVYKQVKPIVDQVQEKVPYLKQKKN